MTYTDIKGATELINKFKENFDTMESSIVELENRKQELEKQFGTSTNRFKLSNIEKSTKAKQELNLINQYLKEAEQRKEELTSEANSTLVKEAKSILTKHVNEVRGNHNDLNRKIVECLYEARTLQKEMDIEEAKEREKVNSFIADLTPFFSDEEAYRKKAWGKNQVQDINEVIARKTIFVQFSEPVYYVKGLTRPYTMARSDTGLRFEENSEQRFNEYFGVEKKS